MTQIEIYEYLQKRLEEEVGRIHSLDDKATTLLEFIAIVISIQNGFFALSFNAMSAPFVTVTLLLIILASCCFLFSAFLVILALKVRDYVMPSVEEAYQQQQNFTQFLSEKIFVAYSHNKKQNDRKARHLNSSIAFFFGGLMILTALVILTAIIYTLK